MPEMEKRPRAEIPPRTMTGMEGNPEPHDIPIYATLENYPKMR